MIKLYILFLKIVCHEQQLYKFLKQICFKITHQNSFFIKKSKKKKKTMHSVRDFFKNIYINNHFNIRMQELESPNLFIFKEKWKLK